jgi:hypothetical protein
LNSKVGCVDVEGGVVEVDNLCVKGGKSLGQEVGSGGPALSISPHIIVKGGAIRRQTKSANIGQATKPIENVEVNSGGEGLRKEGVYSEGPRSVYNMLNSEDRIVNIPKKIISTPKNKELRHISNFLPSNTLRKHQRLARSLNMRKPNSSLSTSVQSSTAGNGSNVAANNEVAKRCLPTLNHLSKNQATSLSSAGDVLCCSPLNSSDIRNCNKIILKKYEEEVVSKVWNGAVELGVELGTVGEKSSGDQGDIPKKAARCVVEIKENEKRDEEERLRREHKQSLFK